MKFSDFPQAVIKENVDYAVKEITNVIKKYGPRESGSENCFSAQKHIKKEMDTFFDGTDYYSAFGTMHCLRRCFCRPFYYSYGIFAL